MNQCPFCALPTAMGTKHHQGGELCRKRNSQLKSGRKLISPGILFADQVAQQGDGTVEFLGEKMSQSSEMTLTSQAGKNLNEVFKVHYSKQGLQKVREQKWLNAYLKIEKGIPAPMNLSMESTVQKRCDGEDKESDTFMTGMFDLDDAMQLESWAVEKSLEKKTHLPEPSPSKPTATEQRGSGSQPKEAGKKSQLKKKRKTKNQDKRGQVEVRGDGKELTGDKNGLRSKTSTGGHGPFRK